MASNYTVRPVSIAFSTAALILALAGPSLVGQTMVGPQQPTRDNTNLPTTGTASISGRVVTDETTPQPVRRARVIAQRIDTDFSRWVMTDAAGRFALNDMPPGRYNVSATKAGFVRTTFGARKFDRPGTPIGLGDGQRVDASMKMLRGAVITGTVRDEFGQAAPGVAVRVMQYRMQNGERTLVGAASGAATFGETTDDRGGYRLFGLAPGEYVISATPRESGRGGNLKQMTDQTLRSAQAGMRQNSPQAAASQPAAQQTPDDGPTVGFTPLYYPGAMLPTDGTTVTVAAGEERDNIDVQLRLVRTSKISGKVLMPDGSPAIGAALTIAPANTGGVNVAAFVSINTAPVQPDGSFTFTGIAPGSYTISARGANAVPGQGPGGQGAGGGGMGMTTMRGIGMGPGGGGEAIRMLGGGTGAGGPLTLWANADVAVDGQNIGGLSLALQEGMKFSGQLAFEGSRPAPKDDYSRARINLLPGGMGGGGNVMFIGGGSSASQVDANGRFTLTGITPGKYRVLANLSTPDANWTLASAMAKGRDMLDVPLDIAPNEDIANAVLTFTDLTQSVEGSLQDSTGRPAPDYTIVVFPADKTLWSSTRRIRTARPGTDGKFKFASLPAGEYRIAALTDLGPNDTQDPLFFNELVPASVAFTLKAGQTHVQNLQIGK